jgi:hypothetical protein
MSLWVDKHRPRSLDELTYNPSLSKSLKAIVPSCAPVAVAKLTVGRQVRPPAFTRVWTVWRGQEDSSRGCLECFIWSWGRETED